MRKLLLIIFIFQLKASGQSLSYKFNTQIDSVYKADTVPWKNQIAAWEYSYIGEYKKALLAYLQKPLSSYQNQPKMDTDKITKARQLLSGYTPFPAIQYILQKAKSTRIVIINEAHHNPRHRVFMQMLLPYLHQLGYNFFGVEAFSTNDTLLMKKGYPIQSTGYYIKEPCFGRLIRTAIKESYFVFPYETKNDVNGKEREIEQAENIDSIYKMHSNEKFIIYCGFDHAIEDSTHTSWGLAMAGRIKKLTGIDPLTIDQVELTESGSTSEDNSFRYAINVNYDAVMVDKKGNAFNKAVANKSFDINVFHPDTKFINYRPDWLYTKESISVSLNKKIHLQFPCLLLAFRKSEDTTQAVPVDIIELKNNLDRTPLILCKKERYIIKAINREGQKQQINVRI
jgi:hypothetical protein